MLNRTYANRNGFSIIGIVNVSYLEPSVDLFLDLKIKLCLTIPRRLIRSYPFKSSFFSVLARRCLVRRSTSTRLLTVSHVSYYCLYTSESWLHDFKIFFRKKKKKIHKRLNRVNALEFVASGKCSCKISFRVNRGTILLKPEIPHIHSFDFWWKNS